MSELIRFPCARCGGALRFSPQEQRLVCAHCGHTRPVASDELWRDGGVAELDYATALAKEIDAAAVEDTQAVTCGNCGATTTFEREVHAAACPFCAEPIVTAPAAHRQFKPGGALPFALTEREAKKALSKWLKSLWFAPGDISAYGRAERPLNGVYLPFWTFDANTLSTYTGERGEVYYVMRTRWALQNGKRVQVQKRVPKVRWTRVMGTLRRNFDDVLVLASRSLPQRFSDRLGGGRADWDLHDLQPYRAEFLAGFRAEAYSVDLEDGFAAARAQMDLQIRRAVRFDIGGDRQRVLEVDTTLSNVTFKHILLPVWIAAYRYRGEQYRFIVNARTGEVVGDRPYSWWKIAQAAVGGALLVLVVAAAIAAIGLFEG